MTENVICLNTICYKLLAFAGADGDVHASYITARTTIQFCPLTSLLEEAFQPSLSIHSLSIHRFQSLSRLKIAPSNAVQIGPKRDDQARNAFSRSKSTWPRGRKCRHPSESRQRQSHRHRWRYPCWARRRPRSRRR